MDGQAWAILFFYLVGAVACGAVMVPIAWRKGGAWCVLVVLAFLCIWPTIAPDAVELQDRV